MTENMGSEPVLTEKFRTYSKIFERQAWGFMENSGLKSKQLSVLFV